MCNNVPKILDVDASFKKYLHIIKFSSTFSVEYPNTEKEQFLQKIFPIDRNFDNKVDLLVKSFMWIHT